MVNAGFFVLGVAIGSPTAVSSALHSRCEELPVVACYD